MVSGYDLYFLGFDVPEAGFNGTEGKCNMDDEYLIYGILHAKKYSISGFPVFPDEPEIRNYLSFDIQHAPKCTKSDFPDFPDPEPEFRISVHTVRTLRSSPID